MRVLVTGAAGQLGSTAVQRLATTAEVIALTRHELDIADEAAVARIVSAARPDAIVNCAAYNDVDGAQTAAADALAVNAMGVLALARGASSVGATLVHYSTDFVFDGYTSRPYVETDQPRPLSTYGSSKLLGEWFARDAPQWYVLRVESLFGGPAPASSVDRILTAIRDGQPARVFADRTVTPAYVEDVVEATRLILEKRPAAGLYHCVNSGSTTWLGLAEEAARVMRRAAKLVPLSVDDVQFKAARPRFCALSNQKLADAGIVLPTWQSALARYILSVQP
jgi:dTDP-4-dehydrorhamnose reductase